MQVLLWGHVLQVHARYVEHQPHIHPGKKEIARKKKAEAAIQQLPRTQGTQHAQHASVPARTQGDEVRGVIMNTCFYSLMLECHLVQFLRLTTMRRSVTMHEHVDAHQTHL